MIQPLSISRVAGSRQALSSLITATRLQSSAIPLNHSASTLFFSGRSNLTTVSSPKKSEASEAAAVSSKIKALKAQGKHLDESLLFNPIYTKEELENVKVVKREPVTKGDKIAGFMVSFMRTMFDVVTHYPSHKQVFPTVPKSNDVVSCPKPDDKEGGESPPPMELQKMRKKGIVFGPEQWLIRVVFLESIAGCPGMVAAVCRHLHSLRLLRKDNGWIHELLKDAENERMHLLTFLQLAKPGIFMRAMLLGAQGVFFNFFFVFYLLSPSVAHRFVGALEEEAVITYTNVIREVENGRLPEWENVPAPEMAIDYWKLEKDAKLLDVIKAVRADEATHRFINHTFASLDQTCDMNPFVHGEVPAEMRGEKYGFEREEAASFLAEQEKKGSEVKEEKKQ